MRIDFSASFHVPQVRACEGWASKDQPCKRSECKAKHKGLLSAMRGSCSAYWSSRQIGGLAKSKPMTGVLLLQARPARIRWAQAQPAKFRRWPRLTHRAARPKSAGTLMCASSGSGARTSDTRDKTVERALSCFAASCRYTRSHTHAPTRNSDDDQAP